MVTEKVNETNSAGARMRTWLLARLVTLSYVYFTCLAFWAMSRFFFQDRWSWLFLLSSLAVYFFFPLPLLLPVTFLARRRSLWLGYGLSLILGLALFGGLFLPRSAGVQAGDASLTVMTYNVLGFNQDTQAVTAALRASEADVVGLGEVSPEMAAAIKKDLADLYPYQVLAPRPGVSGTGIISRYPIQTTGESVPGDHWVGDPQVVTMDFNGTAVTLLHFHAIPLATTGGLSGFMFSVGVREEQAQAIVNFAASRSEPVIILGDLNAGDQHKAYKILTSTLTDAWRQGGWGLGHTFPGAASHRSSRPIILGIPSPMWMVRIDYVFHTPHWHTESAWIGPWDGVSDHRPVMASLLLTSGSG